MVLAFVVLHDIQFKSTTQSICLRGFFFKPKTAGVLSSAISNASLEDPESLSVLRIADLRAAVICINQEQKYAFNAKANFSVLCGTVPFRKLPIISVRP